MATQPQTPAATPTRLLADHLLNGQLDAFVRTRREQGMAWRLVARDLYEATDGVIDLTIEGLRAWFPEDRPRKKKAS